MKGLLKMKIREHFPQLLYLITYKFRRAGIQVNQAMLSGDDSFIDVRYRLSRPDKDQGNFPIYLVDETSGHKLGIASLPKFGLIRSKPHKQQALGILLFYNRDNTIKHGSQITLHFGPLIAKNIKVT